MTALTDLEINKRLALAIGWKEHQMQVSTVKGALLICVDVATLTNEAYWRRFDYRDPAVIWQIAERYNCFPIFYGRDKWTSGIFGTEPKSIRRKYAGDVDTAAKAVALAVIGSTK